MAVSVLMKKQYIYLGYFYIMAALGAFMMWFLIVLPVGVLDTESIFCILKG